MTAQVWVERQGRLEPDTVRIGLTDGNYTEIVDGLAEGTPVALSAVLAPPGGVTGRGGAASTPPMFQLR
jgi:hypothetical protein